jgi:hypothetical protein
MNFNYIQKIFFFCLNKNYSIFFNLFFILNEFLMFYFFFKKIIVRNKKDHDHLLKIS